MAAVAATAVVCVLATHRGGVALLTPLHTHGWRARRWRSGLEHGVVVDDGVRRAVVEVATVRAIVEWQARH